MGWGYHSEEEAKKRLAQQLREHVYPELLHRGFITSHPNKRRPGKFPINYWRERDGKLDVLHFVRGGAIMGQ